MFQTPLPFSRAVSPKGYKIRHHKINQTFEDQQPWGGVPTTEECPQISTPQHASRHSWECLLLLPIHLTLNPKTLSLRVWSILCGPPRPFLSPDHRGWSLPHWLHLRSGRGGHGFFSGVLSIFRSSCQPQLYSRPERDPLSCFHTGFL